MSTADDVAIMMGFFSSASFAEIAPGLAAFLKNSSKSLRLVISPFISTSDQAALAKGLLDPEHLVVESMETLFPDQDRLASHTLECLAWLLANGRIEIRVALMKGALFHPKVWMFRNGSAHAALHGSANMTGQGLRGNREQLSLARSWRSQESLETCTELEGEFEALWSGGDSECLTLPLADAVRRRILRDFKGDRQPSEAEFNVLWRRAHGLTDEPVNVDDLLVAAQNRSFHIPDWLEFRTGEYAHQGAAVDAWSNQDRRGILEMCTGSGKTLTALVGAKLLHEEIGQLLIVVAAPYNVLVKQWCGEISLFGLNPINMSEAGGKAARARELNTARRRLKKGISDCEAIVVSNDTLCTSDFQNEIAKFGAPKLLIADECHNLGANAFIASPPEFFEYRLGLSATPVRQYDDEGTDELFSFFGPPCFSYSLEEAIGSCLTPYEYHVAFVDLSIEEMEEWREISQKISQLSWKIAAGETDEYLESLLLQRRRILETAEAKIAALDELLDAVGPRNLKFTLVYATDKDPEQLKEVNALLADKGVFFHQLTAEETSKPKLSDSILKRFQAGDLQVLTAKRVLDEGVNVPQIMSAYILASTTVRRQWVQRRGRLLRTCEAIGKEFAIIYDLVALPPGAGSGDQLDQDAKKIVNAELDRVWEFARLSRNAAETGGPFEAVERMREMTGG